jgi:hypothetical protein
MDPKVAADLANPNRVGDGVIGNNDPSEEAIRNQELGPNANADLAGAGLRTAPGNDTAASAQGEGLGANEENVDKGKSWLDRIGDETEEERHERLNRPPEGEYAEDDGAGNVVEHSPQEPELKMLDGETDEQYQKRVKAAQLAAMNKPLARRLPNRVG